MHLLVGGVFEGIGDLGGFAEGADARAEPHADEEGGDCGGEDVAGGVLLVDFFMGVCRVVRVCWLRNWDYSAIEGARVRLGR